METKRCPKCDRDLPVDSFGPRKRGGKIEIRSHCRNCEAMDRADAHRKRRCRPDQKCCHSCKRYMPLTLENFGKFMTGRWDLLCVACRASHVPTPEQIRRAKEQAVMRRERITRASHADRIAPIVRQYVASRGSSCGRGRDYRLAHDILADELKSYGRAVEVDGRVWRWSNMAGGIVSEPIRRQWRKSEGPAPDRHYRIDAPGVPSLCGRDSPLEMGLAETLA